MKLAKIAAAITMACTSLVAVEAVAAVSAEEAAKLKTVLTPLGGERAGNKDGSIPEWTGEVMKAPEGYQSGQPRPDPFANEVPLFTITAANLDKYDDKLAEGVKVLIKKHPDFKVNVYKTHRTAVAPNWVYDNTFRNATEAKLENDGLTLTGAYGGVPFPIPKTGNEAMFNHLLRWMGESVENRMNAYVVSGMKTPVLSAQNLIQFEYPYYRRSDSRETFKGDYADLLLQIVAPSFKAGEQIVYRDPVDQKFSGRQAWQYLVGQRRVRKAPTFAYDTPDTTTSGTLNWDEQQVFIGPLDRFEWKLVGKQEMYIPYNTNRFYLGKDEEVVKPGHLNSDKIRWELHRVVVVEGTVAPGKRHVVAKKRLYLDEDTWMAVLGDSWDGQGQMWKLLFQMPLYSPDLPGVVGVSYGGFNFLTDVYTISGLPNEFATQQWKQVPVRGDNFFTPDSLVQQGVR